jgi:hypothetical protein
VATERKGIWVLECLPSKHKALSSNPNTTKNTKEQEGKGICLEISKTL